MLILSSKQITDNFTDIMLKSASDNYLLSNNDLNIRYLKTSVLIRNILQELILKNDEMFIDNIYSKKKVNINHVFNTVYLKGGIIVDYFINKNVESLNISDLDFHTDLIDIKFLDIDYISICTKNRLKITKLLKWISDNFTNPNDDIIMNKLFDNQDTLKIYNSYNPKKNPIIFNRKTSTITNNNTNLNFGFNQINDNVYLFRYFYQYKLIDDKNHFILKINIIDFSINCNDDILNKYSNNLLQLTYFTKDDFIITQNKLSLLNDQFKTLLNSIVVGSQKILKRKLRVIALLSTVTKDELINSNVYICKYNKIPDVFLNDLKNNKIIDRLAESKLFYPYILIPCIIWFTKNSKYIKNKIYTRQTAEFYYQNDLINKSDEEIENAIKNDVKNIIFNFKDMLDVIYLFYKVLNLKQIKVNKFLINDNTIYNKLSQVTSEKLLDNYLKLDKNMSNLYNYRKDINYWNNFILNESFIDDDHINLYIKLK